MSTNVNLTTIVSDELAPALGPYSHAVKAGPFVFLSGNIPIDITGKVVSDDVSEQTEQVCQNILSVLRSAGTDIGMVVKVNIFLADMSDFAAVNDVYAKYFVHKPARSCVAVKQLPKDVRLEIECTALVQG